MFLGAIDTATAPSLFTSIGRRGIELGLSPSDVDSAATSHLVLKIRLRATLNTFGRGCVLKLNRKAATHKRRQISIKLCNTSIKQRKSN